jgi:pimeloyl-ACP methyl ester carboxylesterase
MKMTARDSRLVTATIAAVLFVALAQPGAGQYTASVIPGAKLSVYEGVGHSPFYEDAPRFNAELAAFVRAAAKTD